MHRRWDKSKPPRGPFTFNADCPQAQGVVVWVPQPMATAAFDRLGRTHFYPGTAGTPALDGWGSPAVNLTGASTQYLISSNVPVTAYPMSSLVRFFPKTLVTSWLMGGSDAGTTEYWGNVLMVGGTVRAQLENGGIAETTAVCAAGTWNDSLAVFASTALRTVYLNGGNAVSEATGGILFPLSMTMTTIGTLNTSILPTNSLIGECVMWNIAVDAAISARMSDPGLRFELSYPLRSRKWFSAAAPGGFQAAWASQRSRVIGAGVL